MRAWSLWALALLYLPVGALFKRVWLRGRPFGRWPGVFMAAAFLLLGASLALHAEAMALLLGAYFSYAFWRLALRRREPGMPGFSAIKSLDGEQRAWDWALFLACFFSGLARGGP